jgi:serine/threonine protein phosphatase PrpC
LTALRSAVESHTGYVRTNNEDLAVIGNDFGAIADGMGGHLGGEVAARTAIEQLAEVLSRDKTTEGLIQAVKRANAAIWQRSRSDRSVHGMGTTLTAAALVAPDGDGPRLVLVNVGDSRAYALDRSLEQPQIAQLTEDHTVVEEMVRHGELSPAEAAVHPHRHVLTRALGIDPEVDIDLWELEPKSGTRILLCSDGLSDDVPESEIEAALLSSDDPREAAHALVEAALTHGGMDNVTVAVIDVVDEPERKDAEQLRFAPARPQTIEPGADRGREDVTQALPVQQPGAPGPDPAPTEAVDAAALATTTGAAGLAGEKDGAGSLPPASAETVKSPVAQLFDVEAEEQAEKDEQADSGKLSHKEPGEEKGTRSLVMRAGAPALLNEREPTGQHPRPTVLVPAHRIAKQYRDRVLTVRVVLFVLLLAALFAGVIGVVVWFQRSSYYVGLYHDKVSIFQGRPGGLVWFKPQLLEESNLTSKNLLPNSLSEVKKGIAESSYAAARQQLQDLEHLSSQVGLAPSGSTTTSTTPAGKAAGLRPFRPRSATSLQAVFVALPAAAPKGAPQR